MWLWILLLILVIIVFGLGFVVKWLFYVAVVLLIVWIILRADEPQSLLAGRLIRRPGRAASSAPALPPALRLPGRRDVDRIVPAPDQEHDAGRRRAGSA